MFRAAYYVRVVVVVFLSWVGVSPGQTQDSNADVEKPAVQTQVAGLVSPVEPDWVTEFPVDLATEPTNAADAGGTFFLLVDAQYDLATRTTYYRYLKRLTTESALQDGSQL